MENASKALIIAGAILIAILLIGLGVMVMRGANAPIEQAQDTAASQAIEIFNSKFTGYAGVQSAATAKALVTSIISSNAVNSELQIKPLNCVVTGATLTQLNSIQSNLNNQKKYMVTFTYATAANALVANNHTQEGYIYKVTIKEQ